MLGFMENCETNQKLHLVVCGNYCIFFSWNLVFDKLAFSLNMANFCNVHVSSFRDPFNVWYGDQSIGCDFIHFELDAVSFVSVSQQSACLSKCQSARECVHKCNLYADYTIQVRCSAISYSTIRCSVPHPLRSITPTYPLIAPMCYIQYPNVVYCKQELVEYVEKTKQKVS